MILQIISLLHPESMPLSTTLSIVKDRDMENGMGPRNLFIIHLCFSESNIKKFRNHSGFGTFMVAEAGLEPTTSGL